MGPNSTVVVKNMIQKKITPLTRATLESMIIVNEMIALAIKLSDEIRELRMAEAALEDEPEWSDEGEPDQGEVMIIQKEKEKIKEKTAPKKKLNSKQHQLQLAAKSSKKITEFFSKKRPAPPTTSVRFSPDEQTAADNSLSLDNNMMDWEDDVMKWEETPSLSWKEIERMERNREKAKRLGRIKIQKLCC